MQLKEWRRFIVVIRTISVTCKRNKIRKLVSSRYAKGTCVGIQSQNGSWSYHFEYDHSLGNITIEKGSVTVNGVSLTVVNSKKNGFSVAIIPYTYEHTNFKHFKIGSVVNLEFDVIGKYVSRLHSKATTS